MTEIPLPKPYCACICSNAMTDLCLENCALERKGRWFELRKDLSIQDMPRFPIDEFVNDMTADERKIILGSYTAKLVEQAQGVIYESRFVQRPRLHNPTSSEVSSSIPIQSVLHGVQEAITSDSPREEHQDQTIGSNQVAQPAD